MYSSRLNKMFGLRRRILILFSLIFISILSIITITIFIVFNAKENSNLYEVYSIKINEINQYLNRIEDYTEKFNEKKIKLSFEPEIENQRIVYSKPFNPGIEEFKYIFQIINNKRNLDIVALNTTTLTIDSLYIKENLEKNINKNNELKIKTILLNKNQKKEYYSIIKVTKEIKGNTFNIYILKSIDSKISSNKFLFIIYIISLITGLFLIFLSTNKLTKNILKPINKIIYTAKEISKGDYKNRIEISNTAIELNELVEMLNQMLEKIMIVFEKQSRFISDVSHELRTPISIIKGNAELIERRYINLMTELEKNDPKTSIFIESNKTIINECINMKNLIEALLFLSKGEENQINSLNKIEISSKEILTKLVNDYNIILGKNRVFIKEMEDFSFNADLNLTLQSLRILIDNGLKYSSDNIFLNSKYDEKNNLGIIEVIDSGVGIKESEIENIFDRFYRVDESRNKNTGGYGLGLSIFKQILILQKQDFEIKSKLNYGTTIKIKIKL